MASIATPLIQRRREPEEEQLLRLFWNRAELKKELAGLRRERDRLVDQLRQQEAASLRAQQRLEQLENLLADPAHAANAAVYYQLRSVWGHCRKRLFRLARELADRQQDREEERFRQSFEEAREVALGEVDGRIAELVARQRAVEADLRATDEHWKSLRGFWNAVRRRTARDQADAIRAALEGLHVQVARLRAERREKAAEPAPPFPGLGVEGRRNINLAVIALAQELVIQLAEEDVAPLAREAALRSLVDVNYGGVEECRALGAAIERVVRGIGAGETLMPAVRRRAELLRQAAQYRRDEDPIPAAASFGSVPCLDVNGRATRKALPVNILADDYWEVCTALLN